MKRLTLALLMMGAAFAPISVKAATQVQNCYQSKPNNFPNQGNCSPGIQAAQSAAISVASATTTEIIPLVANQTIYLTSWDVMAAGTNNVTLVYGTGTACATGQVALTGAYPLIAQAGISKGNGLGIVLSVPKGNALCVTTSGGGQLSGSVSYVQF